MTTSPSEPTEAVSEELEESGTELPAALEAFAASVSALFDGPVTEEYGTVKVRVPAEAWKQSVAVARDELGMNFFSWLSATDWSPSVEVGDPPEEGTEDRYEMLCAVADVDDGNFVILSTDLPKAGAAVDSLVELYPGANWHEREANEMFGIDFRGHPGLENLYLPDAFEGYPLRKSFPLLTREVKPWPGKVDVEDMPETADDSDPDAPSTENPEA